MSLADHQGRRVLVAGATGLVGRELLAALAQDPAVGEVLALVRRPVAPEAIPERVRQVLVDYDALERHVARHPADQVACALGTTMRQAGSERAFRKVDLDYPLALARAARAAGARHFLLVSAIGADPRARTLYSRVKGELEEGLRALGFPALTIARPSLLDGAREEDRPLERWASRLAFLAPSAWKPVHGRQVARALARAAREDRPGVQVLENRALRAESRDALA